jgi:hypothetical protein
MIFHGADGYPYPSIVGINSFGIFDYLPHHEGLSEALNGWKSGAIVDHRQQKAVLDLKLSSN